jgi:hypothetical protein
MDSAPPEPFSSAWLDARDTWGASPSPVASRLVNAGACLEPLEPALHLSGRWAELQRALNVDGGALLTLVTASTVRQPRALSLHRRRTGGYFLRVMAAPLGESPPPVREGPLDPVTARLILALWPSLGSRIQMVDSTEFTFDGRAYYFAGGSMTGYTMNPRDGSILAGAVSALDRLAALVEDPVGEVPTDRHLIQQDLRDVLARSLANEPCARVANN